MSGRAPADRGVDGIVGALALGVAAVGFGVTEGLPSPWVGGLLGAVGVAASVAWRQLAPPALRPGSLLPAMIAIALEAVLASYGALTALFAGACGIAFLYWLADDPERPTGNGRNGLPGIAVVAAAVGLSVALVAVLPRGTAEVGVAGGLLALAMALLAVLLNRRRLGTVSPTVGP